MKKKSPKKWLQVYIFVFKIGVRLYTQKFKYSARRLMGSRIIESAAYCNQISLSQVYINRAQNTSVN